KLDELKYLRTFSSFGSSNKILRNLNYIFSLLQLLIYLLKECKRDETIIVYHSLMLIIPIYLLKNFKKVNIILEVEEIYSKVWKESGYKKLETDFINIADKYIVVSDLLKQQLPNKQSVILYGSYN